MPLSRVSKVPSSPTFKRKPKCDKVLLTWRCKTDQVVNADRRMNKLEFHIGEGVRMFWLLFHPLFPISSVLSCLFVYIFGKAASK